MLDGHALPVFDSRPKNDHAIDPDLAFNEEEEAAISTRSLNDIDDEDCLVSFFKKDPV